MTPTTEWSEDANPFVEIIGTCETLGMDSMLAIGKSYHLVTSSEQSILRSRQLIAEQNKLSTIGLLLDSLN